jgi:hypothetical protein
MPKATIQRRRLQWPKRQAVIDSLSALTFQSDTAAMDVQVVHVMVAECERQLIAVSFQTALGSINLTMPVDLAGEMGEALCDLAQQLASERRSKTKHERHHE